MKRKYSRLYKQVDKGIRFRTVLAFGVVTLSSVQFLMGKLLIKGKHWGLEALSAVRLG